MTEIIWSTREVCLQRGGHFWKNFYNNDVVDERGNIQHDISLAVERRTEYRKCGLCGYHQRLEPAKWVDV